MPNSRRSDPPNAKQTTIIGGSAVAFVMAIATILEAFGVTHFTDKSSAEVRRLQTEVAELRDRNEQGSIERSGLKGEIKVILVKVESVSESVERVEKDTKRTADKLDDVYNEIRRLPRRMRDQ